MVVAITGGIGTGKSTVLEIFSELGAQTLSADEIVHQLLRRDDIKRQIREEFGDDVFSDDEIDRKALAGVAFSSEETRRRLESLLHPHVFQEIEVFIRQHGEDVVVVEIPLLFETESEYRFDYTVTVKAPEDLVYKRLEERGIPVEEIKRRLSHQMPLEEKIRRADLVIDNSGSIEETRRQVERIWKDILRR
ncbi:MAG TPA: dephospho-CoA kinase [Nitrospirae bacterium]|nr:dephospho-CoA kinase [Nitrospirota bacterium]